MVEEDMAVLGKVREILAQVLDMDDNQIGSHTSFRDELELDSLQKIELIARTERAFDRTLDLHEVAVADTLADLVPLLRGAA
ncbi:acyl carrier protein [Nocardia sp. NPDC020380]|uniref:acyl carrier protein n=1 Tax=Nocardia sp. NPDC020380 TaxID=3364309 RepID=UPI003788AD56